MPPRSLVPSRTGLTLLGTFGSMAPARSANGNCCRTMLPAFKRQRSTAATFSSPLHLGIRHQLTGISPARDALILSSTHVTCQPSSIAAKVAYSSRRSFSSVLARRAAAAGSTPEKPVKPLKKRVSFLVKCGHAVLLISGSFITGIMLVLGGFFLYDASTYSDSADLKHEITVPSLALNPRRGGPKNLPICEAHLDQADSPAKMHCATKPNLVILGSGWGSVSLLKELDPNEYNVTVISPVNYFLFTPMLPSATVGTLELRSLVEPMRRICRRANAYFLLGSAANIEVMDRLVEVTGENPTTGEKTSFYVPYDKLIIGVGSISNTHGVKGLENCNFLKTIDDVKRIRKRVIRNFELASLPTTTDEERKKLLSFVICGGGPTGVELAAEIYDVVNEDLHLHYPKILRSEVSVHIIQSRSHILNTYDERISEYAMDRFKKDNVDILTNSRVQQVYPDHVEFVQVEEDGTKVRKELPFGLCVWSTGVGQAPVTQSVVKTLGPKFQRNRMAIETDSHLRVIGTPQGEVYAIGDCATVRTDVASQIQELLRDAVLAHQRPQTGRTVVGETSVYQTLKEEDEMLQNISLSFADLEIMSKLIRRKAPQAAEHLLRLKDLFLEFDHNKSGTLSFEELSEMLQSIDKKVTSLPATAQRAAQQGVYLGRKLTRLAHAVPHLKFGDLKKGDLDDTVYRPFSYRHLGSLAYISNAAVFDFNGHSYFGGIAAMYLWRGVYFLQTVSLRNRALMAMDWLKRGLFGRDLSGV